MRMRLPSFTGVNFSSSRSTSVTWSTSESSTTPVSQLAQKPNLGRTYTVSSPLRQARPGAKPSRGKGQAVACQPGPHSSIHALYQWAKEEKPRRPTNNVAASSAWMSVRCFSIV